MEDIGLGIGVGSNTTECIDVGVEIFTGVVTGCVGGAGTSAGSDGHDRARDHSGSPADPPFFGGVIEVEEVAGVATVIYD